MTTRSVLLLFIVLGFFTNSIYAQTGKHPVDSLKRLLVLTKQDTTRVMLNYLVGLETNITRISYWDSLLEEAH
ncbi:MAG: hypothetical protein V4658_08940, partial [Bacteroidota bacterium]